MIGVSLGTGVGDSPARACVSGECGTGTGYTFMLYMEGFACSVRLVTNGLVLCIKLGLLHNAISVTALHTIPCWLIVFLITCTHKQKRTYTHMHACACTLTCIHRFFE